MTSETQTQKEGFRSFEEAMAFLSSVVGKRVKLGGTQIVVEVHRGQEEGSLIVQLESPEQDERHNISLSSGIFYSLITTRERFHSRVLGESLSVGEASKTYFWPSRCRPGTPEYDDEIRRLQAKAIRVAKFVRGFSTGF